MGVLKCVTYAQQIIIGLLAAILHKQRSDWGDQE